MTLIKRAALAAMMAASLLANAAQPQDATIRKNLG